MDLSLLKKKLDGLQQKSSPKEKTDYSKIYWSPKVGKQQIRIVPSAFNQANPFTELKIYYGITNKVMISPTNFGEKDPIALFATKLRGEYNKENFVLAKKLDPKVRIFAPVIVRGEEDKGVRLWQFGKEIYETFLQMAVDEEVGDYTDLMEGRDIKLTTVGPEATGTPYNKTTVAPSMKNTPLGDADQILLWKDNQPNPKETFKPFTFDEMKLALQNWLTPESTEGSIIDDEKEVEEAPKTNYSVNTSTAAVKQSKLDKFDSLFEDESDGLPF
jgi:hypothetical protein